MTRRLPVLEFSKGLEKGYSVFMEVNKKGKKKRVPFFSGRCVKGVPLLKK